MDTNWLINNFGNLDIIWVQLVLLFIGILFIIIAMFRPKENSFIEEKTEKIFEDFITQMDLENEEVIKKIKQIQNELPLKLKEKMELLERRLEKVEQQNIIQPFNQESKQESNPQINQKYEEVFRLYESGESVDSIAKKTKMGHAEIKLILELSRKGFKYV